MISTPNEIRAVPTADCWFGSYKQDEGEDFFCNLTEMRDQNPSSSPLEPGSVNTGESQGVLDGYKSCGRGRGLVIISRHLYCVE